MQESNSYSMHMKESTYLNSMIDSKPINTKNYQSFVGSLIFVIHTKPDLLYVVSIVNGL